MHPKKFALFGNIYQAKKSAHVLRLLSILEKYQAEVYIHKDFYQFLTQEQKMDIQTAGVFDGDNFEADMVLSMGGDGTFLKAASHVGKKNIPILGINTGRLGFLADVSPEAPVMQEEIFGPILPMTTFEKLDEVAEFVTKREKPLALYYFGNIKHGKEILARTSSGGACLNDTIMHIANENIPFGGVGNSGMGHYHGKESYKAFSHYRSVVITPTWLDLPFRYMPYKMFGLVKKIL